MRRWSSSLARSHTPVREAACGQECGCAHVQGMWLAAPSGGKAGGGERTYPALVVAEHGLTCSAVSLGSPEKRGKGLAGPLAASARRPRLAHAPGARTAAQKARARTSEFIVNNCGVAKSCGGKRPSRPPPCQRPPGRRRESTQHL